MGLIMHGGRFLETAPARPTLWGNPVLPEKPEASRSSGSPSVLGVAQ
ncbi:hypothetical protein I545_5977 [Mycobacterium kansasii 662]|uniref:Uncharacterized protein n=1 Tax=Mycobacterium kansasii 662 TaxID=1299326 RepID=X7YTK3_MYCKA|nr:hypothetical protein I545_5977 [Mycobacterium kansasii 662]